VSNKHDRTRRRFTICGIHLRSLQSIGIPPFTAGKREMKKDA